MNNNIAFQKCINPDCNTTYEVNRQLTKCEKCGNLLDVMYNWESYKQLKSVLLNAFSERKNDKGNIFNQSGVWRFRELLPFFGNIDNYEEYSKVLVSLDGAEGNTKPFHLSQVGKYVMGKVRFDNNEKKVIETSTELLSSDEQEFMRNNFYLQFEGANPTGSFKDNGMAAGFTHAKMLGVRKVGCASTGNTSSAVAAYAANEKWQAVVFIGKEKIALGKLAQTLEYGATTVQIEGGDFDDAMAQIADVASDINLYLMNSINPFRLEGQKTIIFRVLDGLNWEVPDWIVVPGGNLGNSSAFGKAFMELKELGLIDKIPRIAIINATGANTLYRLFNEKGLRWNKGHVDDKIIEEHYATLDKENIKAKTSASAIEILKPVNLKKALRSLEFTNGVVEQVTDEEIAHAKAIVGRNGFGCEPASAATVAGTKKLFEKGIIKLNDKVVGILTGHQLKDPNATINYHSDSNNIFANTPITVTNSREDIISALK
jgi:threonine synthase